MIDADGRQGWSEFRVVTLENPIFPAAGEQVRTMMQSGITPRVAVIVPTYNEVENLSPLVQAIREQGYFDVLVVDDDSPDGTGALADDLAKQYDCVHVLHRHSDRGYANACRDGFAWALDREYALIIQMDCDFSHPPRYLPTFLELAENADLVIGSRYVAGGRTEGWGLTRRLLSRTANSLARVLLGLKTSDATSGFRCYRRELAARMPWSQLDVRGYSFLLGSTYQAQRLGARVLEFPITFPERARGESKMSLDIVLEAAGFLLKAVGARVAGGARAFLLSVRRDPTGRVAP